MQEKIHLLTTRVRELNKEKTGETRRGAKNGRSVATTVYYIALNLITFHSSLRSSPSLIPTLFAIRFAHRSLR